MCAHSIVAGAGAGAIDAKQASILVYVPDHHCFQPSSDDGILLMKPVPEYGLPDMGEDKRFC